jgi:hypothetical protein
MVAGSKAGNRFTSSLCSLQFNCTAEQLLKGLSSCREGMGRRGVDVLLRPKSDQVSTLEERSLLSFQRPVPVCLAA